MNFRLILCGEFRYKWTLSFDLFCEFIYKYTLCLDSLGELELLFISYGESEVSYGEYEASYDEYEISYGE